MSFREEEDRIRLGGGPKAIERQHAKGRLTARERVDRLADPGIPFFELGLWAGWNMYQEWGGAPSAGVPQFAAIMGNCVAGGGYLPVLCDKLLMTEGSGLYLAGPALVKAAIGQTVSHEELGGAKMHAAVSGTIDFREKDDDACLEKLRRLIGQLAPDPQRVDAEVIAAPVPADAWGRFGGTTEYDVRELVAALLDPGPFDEYKAEY